LIEFGARIGFYDGPKKWPLRTVIVPGDRQFQRLEKSSVVDLSTGGSFMQVVSKFDRTFRTAAAISIGGIFIAATFILGSQAPTPRVTRQIVDDLGGVERYLTHVSTDKPIYRTGERVYVRGVVLGANDHAPLTSPQGATGRVSFEIKGPKGDTVTSGASAIIDSVVGFSWDIPANQPGGEYTVRISHPLGDAPAERKFDIRAYRAPRLKSQIVFVRDGYGPGDTVTANLHVERAEGGVPAGAKVSVTARVDGAETWSGATTVDASGNAGASFKLPAAIVRGEGIIAMIIEDGGTVETATKTIPILLQTIDLAIYPEGGDLIAGLPNRVYIEGRTPAHKPADMAGVIVDAFGKQVATFRTEHEGRGRFSFVPRKGEAYSLRVTEPAGIKTNFPLPAVKESGVVISAASDIIPRRRNVVVQVAATAVGDYGIALSQHGKEFSFKNITLGAKQSTDVMLSVPRSLDGVIVATVYDDQKTPMAERLLFRQPEHNLKVQIVADRADYVPGDKVTLRVTTTDDAGKPLGAVVGLTITDSSVLEMIEKREQAPRLPVMVLLENEVKNLEDAHVYLDESNPKAPLATDLLLGTQGWRRFATAETGFLSGAVTDASNTVIPGVTVRAVDTATGLIVTTVTNERGAYVFPTLKAGTYRLSASFPGFQPMSVGLHVARNSPVRQDFRLAAAAVKMMAVPAGQQGGIGGGVFPRAVAGVMGGAVAENRLLDLPLNGRAVFDRVALLQEDQNDGLRKQAFVNAELDGAIGRLELADFARRATVANLLTVREYAHTLRPNWTEGTRQDFAETVYWNAGVKTDASTGLATVAFNLSDSVTSFRVLADAFSRDGVFGSGTSEIESVQPFSIEPKIPLQVTGGDVIQLPIGIVNATSRELGGMEITGKGPAGIKFTMIGGNPDTLRPKERTRRFVQIDVGHEFTGPANITFEAKAGSYRDTVSRTLEVQPLGFPHESSTGGVLESNGSKSFEFTVPDDIIRGSLSSAVAVYPTPLASMTDALQSLLRQPNGCFEQTSSTSYPMVMAQQYFLTHTGIDPAIIEKARGLLEVSYKKLTGFESPTRGYEWFGADPGHEALTAYGLMQFTDMSQVRKVDKDMLDRTRVWLLSRRDGKGGFSVNAKALDTFGRAPADTTNAYIVWALIESGEKGLDREVASVKASTSSTQDSYILALGANILHATGDQTGAHHLMEKLAKKQESAGNVAGAVTSITRSGGDALAIETTALSVLAWMREPSYAANVESGLKWIVESNKSGRFGSTQSTILALRAIVAYDNAHARPKAPGRIILTVDGRTVGAPLAFTSSTQGALVMPEFASELGPGRHTVALKMEDGSSMPFSVGVKYHSLLPDSAEQAHVAIQVVLKDPQLQEGGVTEATVSIANKSDQVIPTPVAIIGIPGGLEVRHDQLKELVKSGKIAAYEVIGREVVLYWRYLKAKDKFDLPLSLVAAVPGSYTGPASRTYLYYTDEYKNWAPGLKVSITAR
jgi:A-macroglobulin TED domain/Carboxypeptidase regulatory-like domain/Alpha-2-macroglobulin family/MG2 domain